VCGRMDEECKPCPYCDWWFCNKHFDPEEHDCISLKKLGKTSYTKPVEKDRLGPVSMPAMSAEGFLSTIRQEAKGSVLDENLAKGLGKLSWMPLLYTVGSPLAGVIILISVTSLMALIGFKMVAEGLTMALSLWFTLQSILGEDAFLAAPFLMLFFLAVGGGLMMPVVEYGLLSPAFRSLRRHDESFRKPLRLVEAGCLGPVMIFLALITLLIEGLVWRTDLTVHVLLWAGIILMVFGQIGLIAGLFKLGGKLGNSGFSSAAAMFIVNLVLSLALSPLAIVAGLAGWILAFSASRSALKK